MGRSRTGKTSWARSIEPTSHIYMCNQWNVDLWRDDAKLIIIDDIDCGRFPWKPIFGGQTRFNISGKYRGVREVVGGKPCIYCCNEDMDPRKSLGYDENRWLEVNVIFEKVDENLY